MKKDTLIIILIIAFSLSITAQNLVNHNYPNTDGPNKNPMKGWNSGWWDNFDVSTVGFQYLKWKDFESTDGNFDFNAVENVINRPGSAGKHIILRLYTDWFGNNQTSDAGPQWLYSDYGVERLRASNGKYITNYNHPNYISQVAQAINALAAKYDDDPRIYAMQLGVLGYWGEWHTHTYDDSFEIEDETAQQILTTYKNGFSKVKLMGRYPWRVPLASENIGFHNDFFKPNNGHSDEFDNAIDEDSKWLQGPIGGEIPPIDNSSQFMSDLYGNSTGLDMIETGHYSTMKVGNDERPCLSNPNSENCSGFMAMHRKMGYNFQIESALFAETLLQSDDLSIELNILNIGVAPIYYNWDVQFALIDQNNIPVEIFETAYNLKTIVPDETAYTISKSVALNMIPKNKYKLAVRFIQPNADKTKSNPWKLDARNTYIVFSNDLPVIDGLWDSENALIGGWSILGTVDVENASLSVNDNNLLEDGVKIYPNPSKGKLNIVRNEAISLKMLKVYDIAGRLIKTINLENMAKTKTLDITNLSAGVYNIVIKSGNSKIQRRFIKE